MTTAVSVYAITVGVVMVAWWGRDLSAGALDRPDRSRVEIVLHVVAEVVTACWLITAGIALLATDGPAAVAFAAGALGMLLYTVVVSPGYFLARREMPPAVMFGVLTALTVVALVALIASA